MGAEYELKFTADEKLIADLTAAFGPGQTIEMESTYYDTPCGRLSKKRYTLRCRKENGVSVCTVKAPMKGFGRGEWEVPCNDITAAVDLLCQAGAPEELCTLTRDGAAAICGAKFTRMAIPVITDSFTAELALDCGILTGGGREMPLREVELEYKSGEMSAFVSYADDFAAKYALKNEPLSKFRRALNLYLGE